MAGFKRKEAPISKSSGGSISKKAKKEASQAKKSEGVQTQETETDSEPIVESDTTEHSGDDDGVSWPSDEGEDEATVEKPTQALQEQKMKITRAYKGRTSGC